MERFKRLVKLIAFGMLMFMVGYLKGMERRNNENKVTSIPGKVEKTTLRTRTSNSGRSQSSVGYVPPEGSIVITPKDSRKNLDELVKIERKTWGFTRELGIQTTLFPTMGIGLDFKGFYCGRFGVVGGIVGGNKFPLLLSPTIGISYRLDRISWIRNTEIWAGLVPLAPYPYQIGLRINL